MADLGYQQEYMNFIENFNKLLSVNENEEIKWNEVSSRLSQFCNDRNSELPKDYPKWCSPYFIRHEQAICILAHSKHPTRCLAVVDVSNAKFHRLRPKEKKGLQGGRRLCPEANTLQLASTKRGFWCCYVPILNLKYDMHQMKNDREMENELLKLYDTYIKDMEENPFKGEEKKLAYKQQFDMKRYPNSNWKDSVLNIKIDKSNATAKRQKINHIPVKTGPRPCDYIHVDSIPPYIEGVTENPSSKIKVEALKNLINRKLESDKIYISGEIDKMDYTKSADLSGCFLPDDEGEEEDLEFNIGD